MHLPEFDHRLHPFNCLIVVGWNVFKNHTSQPRFGSRVKGISFLLWTCFEEVVPLFFKLVQLVLHVDVMRKRRVSFPLRHSQKVQSHPFVQDFWFSAAKTNIQVLSKRIHLDHTLNFQLSERFRIKDGFKVSVEFLPLCLTFFKLKLLRPETV